LFDKCSDTHVGSNNVVPVSSQVQTKPSKMKEITITNYKERLSTEETKILIREAENNHLQNMKFLKKAEVWNALN